MYGNLQCMVCPKISSNLISISSLTKNNNYVVLFFDNTALILSPIYKPNSNRISKFRIVTSATRDPFDNLYRIKDLTVFLNEPINYQTNCNNPQPLLTASANRARVVQSIPSITFNKTNSSIDDNLPNHHPTTTPSSATEQLISSDKEIRLTQSISFSLSSLHKLSLMNLLEQLLMQTPSMNLALLLSKVQLGLS